MESNHHGGHLLGKAVQLKCTQKFTHRHPLSRPHPPPFVVQRTTNPEKTDTSNAEKAAFTATKMAPQDLDFFELLAPATASVCVDGVADGLVVVVVVESTTCFTQLHA